MLTNFQTFFTVRIKRKFVVALMPKLPPPSGVSLCIHYLVKCQTSHSSRRRHWPVAWSTLIEPGMWTPNIPFIPRLHDQANIEQTSSKPGGTPPPGSKCRLSLSPQQARWEPQRGPGKHSRGALLEKFFLNSLFQMVHSSVLYISGRRRGPQTSRGPG